MKSNRFSGAEITAIICVVLLMSGIVPAQAQTDYQVKTDAGVSTYRILTAKSEIEAKLNAERGLVSPGMPDLSQVPWRQITRWRLDPISGVSTYRILTAKSEIEAKLNAERGLVSPGMPDLSQVPWRQITRWRLDP